MCSQPSMALMPSVILAASGGGVVPGVAPEVLSTCATDMKIPFLSHRTAAPRLLLPGSYRDGQEAVGKLAKKISLERIPKVSGAPPSVRTESSTPSQRLRVRACGAGAGRSPPAYRSADRARLAAAMRYCVRFGSVSA